MTVYELTIEKIQQLPEPLAQEVYDFVDFLLMKYSGMLGQAWPHFSENQELVEADLADYLANLEDYEDRLARGEIQW